MINDDINNIVLAATYNKKESVMTILNEVQLKELLNTDYSSANKVYNNNNNNAPHIYRGMTGVFDIAKIQPGVRKSQFTSNIYTQLISEILPSWKDYPKRNRSFICTNDKSKAYLYTRGTQGSVYEVLPKNGAKIAICPAKDIWKSFKGSNLKEVDFEFEDGDQFNNAMLLMFDKLGIRVSNSIFNTPNPKKVIDVYNEVDKIVKTFTSNQLFNLEGVIKYKYLSNFLHYMYDHKMTTLELLDKMLDPVNNGFELTTIEKFGSGKETDGSHEIWTDAECLFINWQR